jgi:hypothetical protein
MMLYPMFRDDMALSDSCYARIVRFSEEKIHRSVLFSVLACRHGDGEVDCRWCTDYYVYMLWFWLRLLNSWMLIRA